MLIEKEITVNKNIERVWKVLGAEFGNAHKWASVLKHSEGSGGAFNGSTCSERSCDIKGMGKTREKLLHFSNENHSLSYEVLEGLPPMIKKGFNTWQLVETSAGKTNVRMKMDFKLNGFMGELMQPMMKMMMNKMGNTMLDDFKYYVETGEPSKKKLKASKS